VKNSRAGENGRNPSLDALRGIAVLMVIAIHYLEARRPASHRRSVVKSSGASFRPDGPGLICFSFSPVFCLGDS
jgi:peptidoglycan/LPS O-acetylase OafA/YrhL